MISCSASSNNCLLFTLCFILTRAGLAHWWETQYSPSTNVARDRFPEVTSYAGWVYWLIVNLLWWILYSFRSSTRSSNWYIWTPCCNWMFHGCWRRMCGLCQSLSPNCVSSNTAGRFLNWNIVKLNEDYQPSLALFCTLSFKQDNLP